MKRKLLTCLLAVSVFVGGFFCFSEPVSEVRAEEQVVKNYSDATELTLYTKEAADHLINAGTYRGYYHDRQNMGIYLEAEAVLNVRILNAEEFGQSLTLDLLVDDSMLEKGYIIPQDGSWVSIPAESFDCVPFLRTPESKVQPMISFYISSGTAEPLTEYAYGDDQQAFLAQWDANDHEFAVIEGDSVTLLIPRKDKDYLPGAVSAVEKNMFDSIDEMLDFYSDLQAFYDEFIGLSYDAKDPVDQNVKAKYFVKADKNGVGLAYYNSHMYVAQNSDTVRGYLGEDYWMVLHEVGHGYDGEVSAGDLYLIEVANNILGHHYERTMNQDDYENDGHGWGYMQNMEAVENYYQNLISNGETFASVDVVARLYYMLNLLNATDAKAMISDLHHAWRVEEAVSTTDFIIEHFSETSGYNLVPYFEKLGVYASENTKCRISEAGYPLLNELRNLVTSDEEARNVISQLNLNASQKHTVSDGIYRMVSAENLQELQKTGSVKITLEIDDISVLTGKEISILDGEKVIGTEVIESGEVVFENVPIGTYRVALPVTDTYDYYTDYTYVDVIASVESKCTANYRKVTTNLLKNDAKIQLLGIADWLIAEIVTDIDAETVTVYTKKIQPHWYFEDVYTSVTILSADGSRELYKKEYFGAENYEETSETVTIPVGSIVKVYHKEIDIRLKAASGVWGTYYDEYTDGLTYGMTETYYVITEHGLRRLEWDDQTFEQKRETFYKDFAVLLDEMLSAEEKENKAAYQKIKASLYSAVSFLDEDVQAEFKALYPYLFAEEKEQMEDVVRVSGTTRYETGYKVADALKETLGVEKFEAVIVATGKNFADALAGSYLAVEKNAPIILTNGKDDNIAQLHAYIAANVEAGGKVYILGGEGAVPAEAAVIEGYEVVRLAGKSRYETNLAILAEAGVSGDSIIVATGKSFADSLSASAAKLPILLVKPGAALDDAAKAILAGMKKIYIIGGEGAVSADIADELAAYGEVTRVAGKSRYETSVEVAKTFFETVEHAVVASGKNFPDGLCGGPLAAAMNAPLILTADGKTEAAAGYVAENAIAAGYVLGGAGALDDESVVDIFALESEDEIVAK